MAASGRMKVIEMTRMKGGLTLITIVITGTDLHGAKKQKRQVHW